MSKNTLLEIGVEEIPSRFMEGMLSDLKTKASEKLKEHRIGCEKIITIGTPRRLILFLEKLAPKQETIKKEVKGPPTKSGQVAANGFAKSLGIKIEGLQVKKEGNREYYFANMSLKGKKTEEVLNTVFPEIIKSLYLPISMLWGTGVTKFIRPIHWILCLYGNKIINFEIGDIKSSDLSFGHRFLNPQKIKIDSADIGKFTSELKKYSVIVDQEVRLKAIKSGAAASAKKVNGKIWSDPALLEEVTFLTEFPNTILGCFDKTFLDLPKEVLITSMIKHQKFFPVLDSKEIILPYFVITSNGKTEKNEKSIKEGNEKVLAARLADAKFFFLEDIKVPLKERLERLKRTTLHEKLGSIFDKVQRLLELSYYIAQELQISEEEKEDTKNIVWLCKADLATNMVYEFPELQGIMGREYAIRQGVKAAVAKGIFEHYLPRSSEDALPSSTSGIIVSIADKIDSIVGFFGIGLVPTGSEDPFALRRAGLGITKILLKNDLDILLEKVIEKSYNIYKQQQIRDMSPDLIGLKSKIMEFILSRLKGILLEEKIRPDFIDSVLCANFHSIADSYMRAKMLAYTSKKEWFKDLFLTGDRIARISSCARRKEVYEGEFICAEEREMYRIFKSADKEIETELKSKKYEEAMIELSKLAKPVNKFFEDVMVMVDNPAIRDNRLALLKNIDNMFKNIADFTKVAM